MPAKASPKPVSIEEARKIKDCFGPCTTLYECWETKELVANIAESHGGKVKEFINSQLTAEYVRLERENSLIADEYPEKHAQAVKEAKIHISEIKTRLREAGFKVR